VVPTLLWSLQRRKSATVRYHALQAMSYQIISFWAWTILMPLLMIVIFVGMFGAIALADSRNNEVLDAFAGVVPLVAYVPMLAMWGLYVLVGFIGAAAALMGRNFRYPFLGAPLARKLEYQPQPGAVISDTDEDQVAAAASHGACIIPMFGALLPLIVWITQKERGGLLRFQSLQALLYQALGTAAYLVIMVLYFLSFLLMMGGTVLGAAAFGDNSDAGLIALLVTFLPATCLIVVLMIGGPLYHLFGFIASVRVLRGHDYNYPVLGRYLRKRSAAAAPEAPA
jgi:uncharacterized Tic20 family protein